MLRVLLALVLFAAPQDKSFGSGLPALAQDKQAGSAVSGRVTVGKDAKKKVYLCRYTGTGVEKRKPPSPSNAVVWIEGAPKTSFETRTVKILQQGLEFRPRVLAITAGSTVEFPNGDDLFHNVFAKPGNKNEFNLGRYTREADPTPARKLSLPGRIDVRCDVHDHMRAYIHVFRHPYFALASDDGAFSIPDVPPGKYTLVAWKEDYNDARREIEFGAAGLKVDLDIARLEERPADRIPDAGCCPPSLRPEPELRRALPSGGRQAAAE